MHFLQSTNLQWDFYTYTYFVDTCSRGGGGGGNYLKYYLLFIVDSQISKLWTLANQKLLRVIAYIFGVFLDVYFFWREIITSLHA